MNKSIRILFLLGILFAFTLPTHAVFNRDPFPSDDGDGGGSCSIGECITTCTGPTAVECCCFYTCPSGGTWVCHSGYCPNTDRSCL